MPQDTGNAGNGGPQATATRSGGSTLINFLLVLIGVIGVGLLTFPLAFGEEASTEFFVFGRFGIALCGGLIAGGFSGFIWTELTAGNIVIRAGGGAAIFVVIVVFFPDPIEPTIENITLSNTAAARDSVGTEFLNCPGTIRVRECTPQITDTSNSGGTGVEDPFSLGIVNRVERPANGGGTEFRCTFEPHTGSPDYEITVTALISCDILRRGDDPEG